jgi:hypothetical protein
MAQRSSRQFSVRRNCCLKINLKTQMLRDVIEIRWHFSALMVEPSKVRAWTMLAVTWSPKMRHRQGMLPWRSRSDDHGMLLIIFWFVAWCKVLVDIQFEIGSWHMPFGNRSHKTCDAEGWHVFGKTCLRIEIPRLSIGSSVLCWQFYKLWLMIMKFQLNTTKRQSNRLLLSILVVAGSKT